MGRHHHGHIEGSERQMIEYRIRKITTLDGVVYCPEFRYTGWKKIFGWDNVDFFHRSYVTKNDAEYWIRIDISRRERKEQSKQFGVKEEIIKYE